MRTLLVALVMLLAVPVGAQAQVRPGDTPSLRATALNGSVVSTDGLRGRVVIVDFWATWCEPCRSSLTAYQSLVDELGEDRVTVVAVSIDRRRQAVQKFVDDRRWSLTFVWDHGQRLAREWKPTAVPATYVLSQRGEVVRVFAGYDAEHLDELRTSVLDLLGGKP